MIFICEKCGEPITFLMLNDKNLKEELSKHKCTELYTEEIGQIPKRKRIMTKTYELEPIIGDISEIHEANIADIRKWLKQAKNKEINPKHICPFTHSDLILNPCKELCQIIFENLQSNRCPCHIFGPTEVIRAFQIVCAVHKVYYKK